MLRRYTKFIICVLLVPLFSTGGAHAELTDEPAAATSDGQPSAQTNPAGHQPSTGADDVARVSSLTPADIVEFSQQSAPIRHLLSHGLSLTGENLAYKYGSDDPSAGGMDCSGTIHYLLEQAGIADVPRDSSDLYAWVWKAGHFQAVVSTNPDTFELSRLHPGDLLFWTGTYRVDRDPPVTHVMIYLGISRITGRRVMVGASDGRTFNDVPRFGVSVFDFKLPGSGSLVRSKSAAGNGQVSRFIGYSPVPGIEEATPLPTSREAEPLHHG